MLNNGWTRDDLIRYNSFVQFVKNERKLVARKEYEDTYLDHKKRIKVINTIDKNKQSPELELIVPYVDSLTDEDSDDDGSDEIGNLQNTGPEIGQEEAERQEESDEETEQEDDEEERAQEKQSRKDEHH